MIERRILMSDQHKAPQPIEGEHQQIMVVTQANLEQVQQGTAVGVIATILDLILLGLYAMSSNDAGSAAMSAIRNGMITNPVTLTGISVILAIFGVVFHDASCMLIASACLIGSVIADVSTFLSLIPAVLLMVAYTKMKNRYKLLHKRVTIEADIKK